MLEAGELLERGEYASPLRMEELLREVTRETNSSPKSKVILPYFKQVGPFRTAMAIRRDQTQKAGEHLSIDVGFLSPNQPTFSTFGYLDVAEVSGVEGLRSAVAGMANPAIAPGEIEISREVPEPLRKWEAIFVMPEAQHQGVGISMTSAARVILNEVGIGHFLFRNIATGDGPSGVFYRKGLGGLLMEEVIPEDVMGNEQVIWNMLLPTESTPEHPYMFK